MLSYPQVKTNIAQLAELTMEECVNKSRSLNRHVPEITMKSLCRECGKLSKDHHQSKIMKPKDLVLQGVVLWV